MESFTFYQASRTRLIRMMRRDTAKHNMTTHLLSRQHHQIENEESEKGHN